ncbi:MAG: phosphoribosyltransferase family protein [Acidimicrobiia bacterium]|nr:MAG: phosphoribosyltransferase family protein [Acidimicrobiia bacterium]
MYRDRIDAGEKLAAALSGMIDPDVRPLVLGIPRGGVPVAAVVAERLDGDLDVLVAHKLGAPGNPEFAIGAVAEDGSTIIDDRMFRRIPEDYVREETARQLAEVRRRAHTLRDGRPAIPVKGRVCVVVDDGVATGSTLEASLRLVERLGAAKVIAAVPVGPPDTIRRLSAGVDVVCPLQPKHFFAVGGWYEEFDQVPDEDVAALLNR